MGMQQKKTQQALSERFYEGLCAPFDGEPTRDRMAVVKTPDGKGEGLAALKSFAKGALVFKFWGKVVPHQTLFTLQKTEGVYVEDPLVMGKVLHSCEPNMICDMESQTFTALRDIDAGEFLTMDYETTEDVLYRAFNCGCGATLCRGPIQGKAVSVSNDCGERPASLVTFSL